MPPPGIPKRKSLRHKLNAFAITSAAALYDPTAAPTWQILRANASDLGIGPQSTTAKYSTAREVVKQTLVSS